MAALTNPDNPRSYGINLPTAMVIAAFCAIAWVNTLEMQARIWLKFKRFRGLYFWCLVLSSWGCAIHALGFVILDFRIIMQANAVGVVIGVSWWCMVTGQALVLYSRLHLVVQDSRKVRWVLVMIITNFFILHLPIMLLSQMVSPADRSVSFCVGSRPAGILSRPPRGQVDESLQHLREDPNDWLHNTGDHNLGHVPM